jgi:hypothetical protein
LLEVGDFSYHPDIEKLPFQVELDLSSQLTDGVDVAGLEGFRLHDS